MDLAPRHHAARRHRAPRPRRASQRAADHPPRPARLHHQPAHPARRLPRRDLPRRAPRPRDPPRPAPPDLAALSSTWLTAAARHPSAPITWLTLHSPTAHIASLPPGHYTLCAAAIHGDTDDPSFTARLEARSAPIPLHCIPLALAAGDNTQTLVIPAAHRVWLGDAPLSPTTSRQVTSLPSRW